MNSWLWSGLIDMIVEFLKKVNAGSTLAQVMFFLFPYRTLRPSPPQAKHTILRCVSFKEPQQNVKEQIICMLNITIKYLRPP